MSSEVEVLQLFCACSAFLWPRGWWAGPLSLRKVTAKKLPRLRSIPTCESGGFKKFMEQGVEKELLFCDTFAHEGEEVRETFTLDKNTI